MTSRALLKLLTGREFRCVVLRQRGSHVIVRCGTCQTVIPMHSRDLAPGTWADIRTTLTPCPGRKVVAVKKVRVTVRRDSEDSSAWLVNVVGQPGAQTFGRSLGEAKRHGTEMVGLWFELEPAQLDIKWDIRLGDLAGVVTQARAAMAHAEADRLRRDEAVKQLSAAGVSYRDVAELLGLSHQRVAQIAKAS